MLLFKGSKLVAGRRSGSPAVQGLVSRVAPGERVPTSPAGRRAYKPPLLPCASDIHLMEKGRSPLVPTRASLLGLLGERGGRVHTVTMTQPGTGLLLNILIFLAYNFLALKSHFLHRQCL